MMIRPNSALLAVALALSVHAAVAATDEDRVLAAVRKAYPGTKVDRAERTPMRGVYEVWMGGNVAFVSAGDPRYMVFGRLVDMKAMRDLTASRLRDAQGAAADPANHPAQAAFYKGPMPTADAITVIRGAGQRVVSVFTDPSCGFCRQLEPQLQQLRDVTIHYFLVPFQGSEAPIGIWCAKDRVAAYLSVMSGGEQPTAAPVNCPHPLDRNRALAAKLQVQATPTLVFSDGAVVPGVMSADELETRLKAGAVKQVANERANHAKPLLE